MEKRNNEEILRVSEDYKKAYNQADKLCRHMPQVLKGLELPKDGSEYSKGFNARVELYQLEQLKMKQAYQKFHKNFGRSISNKDKEKEKDRGDKEIEK
jgi:hypothetical protein